MAEVTDLVSKMKERAGMLPAAPEPDYTDLVPDAEEHPRTDIDIEIDNVLAQVDIVEAYIRWCGKMTPIENGKRESIMCSCPKPEHPDKNPSAWINIDKQVWSCGGCQEGGDKFDIAAYHFGFPVPEYKGKQFPELRRRMAEDLGWVQRTTPGGTKYLQPLAEPVTAPVPGLLPSSAPISAPDPTPVPDPGPDTGSPSVVTVLPGLDPPWAVKQAFTGLDFGALVQPETFLSTWMTMADEDDLPAEYYFWLGLQALGFAAGHDAVLVDTMPVKANLFVCLVGSTGLGKSRTIMSALSLLREAMPWDANDGTGTQLAATPASAESLIDAFCHPEHDPTDPNRIIGYKPIRGYVRFDELSNLTSKAARTGNTIKPTLMEFYDNYGQITTRSRANGTTVAERPFCQVITTTQPKAVADLIKSGDEHSGFLNRWIFAYGRPKKLSAYRGVSLNVGPCSDALKNVRAWCSTGRELELKDAALQRWVEFFDSTIEPIKLTDEEPMLGRIDLILKKLILLFAVNAREDTPSLASVERAIKLYEYISWSYGCIRKSMGRGDYEDAHDLVIVKVVEFKARVGNAPSMRDIKRVCAKVESQLLVRVVENMIKMGELEEEFVKHTRGRPSTRYTYVG